jgi:hypothetical protein
LQSHDGDDVGEEGEAELEEADEESDDIDEIITRRKQTQKRAKKRKE